jgi:hypothetical protein
VSENYHGEDGKIVRAVDFDYSGVDAILGEIVQEKPSIQDIELALDAFRSLLKWIWQNGKNDSNGIQIRSMIVCWIFLEELRSLSMEDIANGFGKHKQSLGRWHDDFKKQFPMIKTQHMTHGK